MWGRGSGSNVRHIGEEPRDALPRQAAGPEYQPGTPVAVRPLLEFDRRVRDMLDEMNYDRPAALLDCEKPFDAQEVGSAQCRQHRHRLLEACPGQRFFEDQRKTAESMAMLGFAQVEAVPRRGRLGQQEERLGLPPGGGAGGAG